MRSYAAQAATQQASSSMDIDISALLHGHDGGDGEASKRRALTPAAIVSALDAHIVGQGEAKRAVAVALRNRWRRQQVRMCAGGEARKAVL